MKKVLACALFVSFFTFQLDALDEHDDKCRKHTHHNSISKVQHVETDLVNGIWHLSATNGSSTFEFQENGIASLVSEHNGEVQYDDFLWNLQSFQNSIVLYLTNSDYATEKFTVVQNCEGILLNSLDGQETEQWKFERPLNVNEIANMQSQLIGKWKSIPGSEDASATRYNFHEDGTIVMDEAGIQTPGIWEITKDGQFLLITLQNDAGRFIDHFVLRIYDMDFHSASFSMNGRENISEIQYFEKL